MIFSIFISACLTLGLLLVSGIGVRQFSGDAVQLTRRPQTMRQIVEQANNTGGNFITHWLDQLRSALQITGNSAAYGRYCRLCAVLAAACAVAALFIGNPFLAPIAALIGLYAPVLYAQFSCNGRVLQETREIQVTLSIITSSYKRTKNLLKSVSENIDYIHEPLKSVFERFKAKNSFVTSRVEQSIIELKSEIHNDVWREWCDTLILCYHDHSKIDSLDPIVSKLRGIDEVQTTLDAILYEPVESFAKMLVITLGIIPVIYFINKTWFFILFGTLQGKLSITVTFAALLFAITALKKVMKPIEYRR